MNSLSRRDYVRLGATASALGVLGTTGSAGVATAQSSGSWPQFQRDAANTGYLPDATGPTTGLTEKWSFSALDGTDMPASAVAADGRVFFGSMDGRLYAVDAESGEETWSVQFDERVPGVPAVVDGAVYTTVADGTVRALDVETGKQQWRHPARSNEVNKRLIPFGDKLFVPFGHGVSALDREDGSLVWESRVSGNAGLAVTDTGVFAADHGTNRLFALDTGTGTERWGVRLDQRLARQSTPTVADSTVFVGGQSGGLFAVSTDGSHEWTFDTGTEKPIQMSPAVADGSVVFGTDYDDERDQRPTGSLYVVSAEDGSSQAQFRLRIATMTSPTVVGSTVYTADRDGIVYGFDLDGGSALFRHGIGTEARGGIAFADGVLYVLDQKGILHALEEGSDSGSGGTPERRTSRKETPVVRTPDDETPVVQTPGGRTPRTGTPNSSGSQQARRGFFTNGGNTNLGPLGDPFVLTVGGFLLSVAGIMKDMISGG